MKEQIVYVKVKDLRGNPNNPRKNDDAVDVVAKSIEKYGFRNPLIIDENKIVWCGNTRLKASKKLKLEEVPCIIVNDLTEQQMTELALLDNKTNEIADWDNEMLKEILEETDLSDFDLDWGLPQFDEEIEKHNKLADKFLIPPFDVFNAKSKEWLDRKRIWNALIQDKGQARNNVEAYNTEAIRKYDGLEKIGGNISILDPVLSEIVISWFAPKGKNKMFDCFAGDTVFGYVASYKGNEFTGIELRQEQVDFNNAHTNNELCHYICDDAQNIDKHIATNSQDFLFSCPPYFDLEVYSDLKNDASNQKSFDDFYKILDNAFTKAVKCLKDNRFAVIVVGDVRDKKTGKYYNFTGKIIDTFTNNGMILYNNIKLLTPIGSAIIRAGKNMKNRKTTHIYQDVLVFYKGDTKKIQEIFGDVEVANYEGEDLEL